MSRARGDQERWHALMDALSQETLEMPDEIILREYGDEAAQDSELVKTIIQAAVGELEVSPYEATKASLDREKMNAKEPALPYTPEQRRSLLEHILGGGHPWSDSATLAFRELSDPADLTDDEVAGILEDLAELNNEDDA